MNEGFLSRWSRRKHDSRRDDEVRDGEESPSGPRAASTAPPSAEHADAISSPPTMPVDAGVQDKAGDATRAGARSESAPELPPIDSLTPESDFRAFMRPGVDASARNAALAQLFRDPRYNVMDGLDVYIDDYTQPDPIPPSLLAKLQQLHTIGLSDEEIERRNALGDLDDPASPQKARGVGSTAQVASDANDDGADAAVDSTASADAVHSAGTTDATQIADAAADGTNENNARPQETQG
ncbi:MAG: DUF3306 domain-containing protein [Burkholderiaceae bacterium]|jgi:hypothetical protein|nr:DUF3306 domain-containing protein [Burkholderiaceae bacterium]